MPTKSNLTVEIKCHCRTNTIVDVEPATVYCKLTRFMCVCGRTYHIIDYYNSSTPYREISAEEDNAYLKEAAEDAKKEKIRNPTEEGRRKYQVVDKWLNAQSTEFIAGVEQQRTFHQVVDKDFVIETLLEHCRYEDNLLDELYEQYILSLYDTVDFHASGPQCFTDKRDWYIISIHDLYNGMISRLYSSKEDADTVVKKLMMDKDNYDVAYTIISVPKGEGISL